MGGFTTGFGVSQIYNALAPSVPYFQYLIPAGCRSSSNRTLAGDSDWLLALRDMTTSMNPIPLEKITHKQSEHVNKWTMPVSRLLAFQNSMRPQTVHEL